MPLSIMDALSTDLRQLISGEVFTDPVNREIYATAACLFRIKPRAVVCPRSAGEVARLVSYAGFHGISVTARGAGSGVAGQAVGPGIVIDFQKHLNRILAVNYETREAIVEPGVILADLNRALSPYSLMFPPDPSSGKFATIGGMIANNSSGPRSLKYRDTRAWVKRLKVVLADGSTTWLEEKPALPLTFSGSEILENRIYSLLPALLKEHEHAISASRPRVKNSSGYHVWDLMNQERLNPVPLIVGSEGTLAIVVKAALELARVPPARTGALLFFSSLAAACDAVPLLLEAKPAALELMDRLFIDMVGRWRPDFKTLFPESAQALLLAEMEGEDEEELRAGMAKAMEAAASAPGFAGYRLARNQTELLRFHELRSAASPVLYRLPGKRLTRFVEDVVIPPQRLGEGVSRIAQILKKHGTEAPFMGHAGEGNLHLNPRLDLEDPEDRKKLAAIAEEIYELVLELGGSISGEHGDGILRAAFLPRAFPRLMPLFRELKNLFDPENILNPGKVLGNYESIPLELLKFEEGPAKSRFKALESPALREMLLRCHGCGLCRGYCPSAQATGMESGLARSRFSLLRAVLYGRLDPGKKEAGRELFRALSLCLGCERCEGECPTGLDPREPCSALLSEMLSRFGRPAREVLLARGGEALAVLSCAPGLAAGLSRNALLRSIQEKALGVRKEAALPLPAPASLDNHPKELPSEKPAVLFYPGCLGRWADGEGETAAGIELLRRFGFQTFMPELPCCGMSSLSAFNPARARAQGERLLNQLLPYVREGTAVVTSCPSCALVMRKHYPRWFGERGEELAAAAYELMEFAGKRAAEPGTSFPGLSPRGILFHRSCHFAALFPEIRVPALMERMPGLYVSGVIDACCGQAGPFGFRKENAEISDRLGERLVSAVREAEPAAILSPCPMCRNRLRALGLETLGPARLLVDFLNSG